MSAYYNENDPQKAAWLRELIATGAITPGEVDERSICDVRPDDLRGFRQCHFFAGIGVWSYSLRIAGWPDDREVWTGSCPCPSFSAAGKGAGFADPRHLWPDWFRLIRECRPATVFGEQVKAAIQFGWLDLVATDLESADYAFGAAVLPAAGIGAPHIRDRVWFVGVANGARLQQGRIASEAARHRSSTDTASGTGLVAHAEHAGYGRPPERPATEPDSNQPGERVLDGDCAAEFVDDTDAMGRRGRRASGESDESGAVERLGGLREVGGLEPGCGADELGDSGSTGLPQRERDGRVQRETLEPHQGQALERGGTDYWRNPVWIPCRDGKWRPLPRPVESELESMPDGAAADLGLVQLPSGYAYAPLIEKGKARVMRLRGYGDAINAQIAAAFIECAMQSVTK